jgi:hypothetical protein
MLILRFWRKYFQTYRCGFLNSDNENTKLHYHNSTLALQLSLESNKIREGTKIGPKMPRLEMLEIALKRPVLAFPAAPNWFVSSPFHDTTPANKQQLVASSIVPQERDYFCFVDASIFK